MSQCIEGKLPESVQYLKSTTLLKWCVLSKVYERLALRQMADFLGNNSIFNPNNNAYRRGHSTTTRDDILRAMKTGDVCNYSSPSGFFESVWHCRISNRVVQVTWHGFFEYLLEMDNKLLNRKDTSRPGGWSFLWVYWRELWRTAGIHFRPNFLQFIRRFTCRVASRNSRPRSVLELACFTNMFLAFE